MKVIFDGRKIPGLSIENAMISVEKEKIMKQRNNVSTDTQNRKYVIDKIKEYIKDGKTEEQALDIIMKDEIVESFRYLEKMESI